ncbi:CGNR zinc finger domain-containing protein [Amycolatopsis magusensis]|uniref:CGNR zinc finger domain-containing protein n=1 Tax=Amycolatopsis magusensis TaxID=882444 RepID=UPI0037B13F21
MQVELEDYARGAALATALVNTSGEVLLRSGDALDGVPALAAFLGSHGLSPDVDASDLADVVALRTRLRSVIDAVIAGEAVPDDLESLVSRGSLTLSEGKWALRTPDASAGESVALLTGVGLLGVLRSLSRERFRACAADTCRGVFVDSSRAGRRRYCMPDICGNRTNVARHRSRHR